MTQREQFDEWINNHRGLLFKVIRAYTSQEDDANDLFQEIAIQIWNSITNFRGESAASTWLYRIALNTAIKWNKKARKHTDNNMPIDGALKVISTIDDELDERLEWLYQEISLMDKIDKSLTILLLDGYNYAEMADIMGISQSNVGVKIHRIKKHLLARANKLEDNGI